MKNTVHALTALVLWTLLSPGCATKEGAYQPVNNAEAAVENRAKVVLLDKAVQRSVDCSSIQEKVLPDGRLQVTANLRNRENRRIEVQVDCAFKDEQGFPVDETPFRILILTENAQEAVQFTSLNNQARTYTIRVRQSR